MIELHGLRLQYPEGPGLAFADTLVPPGGVLLLQGDSGTGKSSLLALLAGLIVPSAGHALVAGTNPAALRPSQRDHWRGNTLGLLPQRNMLSGHLTVWQHVAMPYLCAGQSFGQAAHHAIEQVLAQLDIHQLAQRRADTLSGGQAQRVALARALVRQPRVVLADEPTASLDDTNTARVLSLLTAACDHATLVIATHDARVARHLAGRPHIVLALEAL